MLLFSKKDIAVSICVPVYGTEMLLDRCFNSVAAQNFSGFELVVVDDCSNGTDEKGRNCSKIVKDFKKSVKFPVTYIKHQENKGIAESRKTAIYASKGKYLIFLDSDDTLKENAVEILYKTITEKNCSVVQGIAQVFGDDLTEDEKSIVDKKVNCLFEDELKGSEFIAGFLENSNHSGFLWAKIYERETILNAISHIPPIYCILAEDFLIYFWVCYEASKNGGKYMGIKQPVYNYWMQNGITRKQKIEDLDRWEKTCSVASAFTALFTEFEEINERSEKLELNEAQYKEVKRLCRAFLANNIKALRSKVIPELQQQAYQILCEFWGDDFVKDVEKLVDSKEARGM